VKLAASTGQRLPAFATAAGKALLANLPEATVKKVLEHGMEKYTAQTIQSPDLFLKSLSQIRKQGFAIAEQEYEDGINAVSAPILDTHGMPVAAITVTGPAYRLLRERMHGIGPDIVVTAKEISQEFEMKAISKP
jgi:DNA-binding IclR family transcriptional regulator